MSLVSPALCYVRLWVGDALDIIDQIWPQNHIWYMQMWVGNAGDIIDLIWPYSHVWSMSKYAHLATLSQ